MQGIHGGDIYTNTVKLDFSVNVNPFGIPKGVEDALHQTVVRCQQYPDIRAFELKEAVAKQLAVPKEYYYLEMGPQKFLWELYMPLSQGMF